MKTRELLRKFIDDAREDGVISKSAYDALNGRFDFYTEVVFDENTEVNGIPTSEGQALNLAGVMRSINSMRTYMNGQYSELYNDTGDDDKGNSEVTGYEKAMKLVDDWLEQYYA